ncbi:KLTH0F15708p [Lachancea thermotolerans CBS 6340]|uniref:KLTH0F15708p n=1 Tax=Lachancea thermotolerans (strain ATCC 56472 / CBS 6340 / NRRL Y-8284) TaxID=559295 RepID=C5DJE2_LACTC|nr:KLTH0F15708p [Lachancea thermotolerans CBS 6340]CAR24431.1 KLTH0F15708p [Lachancea thermotolerans CBS 6340]
MCARNKNTNKGTFYTQEQSVWAPDLIQLLCLELDFRLKVSQADEKSFPFSNGAYSLAYGDTSTRAKLRETGIWKQNRSLLFT